MSHNYNYFSPSLVIFMILYLISFLFVLNSDDWFLIWVGLELNMLSFILLIYNQSNLINIESCLKYFFIQSLGSAILLGGFYFLDFNFMFLCSFILCLKMGIGPFFFWFPSVCSGLGWGACFFLMSLQKIMPFILMMFFMSWILLLLVILSLFFGSIGSFNQNKIKYLMAYSSIHHSGWIMLCMIFDNSLWMFYLLTYAIIIGPMMIIFKNFHIESVLCLNKWKYKWWFVMSLLSMGGMPPMLGFFLKWIVFFFVLDMSYGLIMMMILMSIIMFYVYVRIIYNLLMTVNGEIGWGEVYFCKNYFCSIDFLSIFGGLICSVLIYMMLY